ncbi:MAG TPA: ribonuclease G, partial [Firmicutes bacterium]|nr:ribonuclease G [Bacillota bacterium]
ARSRKVWLDCGGYLIFDQTEALLSIDVNTGKYVGGQDLRTTVLKTNVQAAKEIAYQLRLRNVGGIIIIDFIDMPPEDREIVLAEFAESLAGDKTQSNLLGFTELGLVEMTRRKNRKLLSHILDVRCPLCQGRGRVAADETIALEIAGKIRSLAREEGVEAVLVKCHSAVGAQIIGPDARNLAALERETGKSVYVRGSDDYQRHYYKLVSGRQDQIAPKAQPVEVGERITATISEPCANQAQNGIARLNGFVIHCLKCGPLAGRTVELEIVEVLKTCAVARLAE